jgi:hypothetical protein
VADHSRDDVAARWSPARVYLLPTTDLKMLTAATGKTARSGHQGSMAGLEDYLGRENDKAQDQAEDHRSGHGPAGKSRPPIIVV